eukprot:TRINITY_DN561_c0_g1_i11.p1 TRINITY_DN561_c0_g1~~TRINITY_DN561_c0_g1_i11.p1  ORF type:complete len:498 (-),score=-10.38 TRINITY_DN561_c0_g1_i11:322-1782(-)
MLQVYMSSNKTTFSNPRPTLRLQIDQYFFQFTTTITLYQYQQNYTPKNLFLNQKHEFVVNNTRINIHFHKKFQHTSLNPRIIMNQSLPIYPMKTRIIVIAPLTLQPKKPAQFNQSLLYQLHCYIVIMLNTFLTIFYLLPISNNNTIDCSKTTNYLIINFKMKQNSTPLTFGPRLTLREHRTPHLCNKYKLLNFRLQVPLMNQQPNQRIHQQHPQGIIFSSNQQRYMTLLHFKNFNNLLQQSSPFNFFYLLFLVCLFNFTTTQHYNIPVSSTVIFHTLIIFKKPQKMPNVQDVETGHNNKSMDILQPLPTKIGNSTPIGLFAFGMTTMMFMYIVTGWAEASFIQLFYGYALFYGGILQLLAGLLDLYRGITFTSSVFTSYGAFWLGFYMLQQFDDGTGFPTGFTLYFVQWGVFTSVFCIIALFTKPYAIKCIFITLTVMFFMLAGGVHNEDVNKAAGYVGFVTSFLAFYTGCALVIKDEMNITLLGL